MATAQINSKLLGLAITAILLAGIAYVYYDNRDDGIPTQNNNPLNPKIPQPIENTTSSLEWIPITDDNYNPLSGNSANLDYATAERNFQEFVSMINTANSMLDGRSKKIFAEPIMKLGSVMDIAKAHEKIQEFIGNHPNYSNWTVYDGRDWHVAFYDLDLPQDWAYVVIDDKAVVIVQIYVVEDGEVFLDWPTATLTADDVLNLVANNSVLEDYLNTFNESAESAWIWFDGHGTWIIGYFSLNDGEPKTVEAENQDQSEISDPRWMELHLSDTTGNMLFIASNYEESSLLVHSFSEVNSLVTNQPEYVQFSSNGSNLLSRYFLLWDYSHTEVRTYWMLDFGKVFDRFVTGFDHFQFLSYSTFEFLFYNVSDSDLEVTDVLSTGAPIHTPESFFSTFLTNQTVTDFVVKYDRLDGYIAFNPIQEQWTVSIFPNWIDNAHIIAELSNSLEYLTFEMVDLPAEELPIHSPSEIESLIVSTEEYQNFTLTYNEFGEPNLWMFYTPNNSGTGGTWDVSVGNDVIVEAFLKITVNDTSGNITEIFRSDPMYMPTHNISEIEGFVMSLPEVQDFINSTSDYTFIINYFGFYEGENNTGYWKITLTTSDYRQIMIIEIVDVGLEIIGIYVSSNS